MRFRSSRSRRRCIPAEFGGKASALINVVTKSGGNSFHGSALEFVRNEQFDAHNYFDDPGQADAAAPPEPVRRQRRRSAQAGSDVLLLQLRRAADPQGADADLLGADGGAAQRRFLGPAGALRSADAHRGRTARRLPAIRFRRAASVRSRRRCWPRCRCRRAAAWSRTCSASKTRSTR